MKTAGWTGAIPLSAFFLLPSAFTLRVRGNGCPELEMGSVKFHATPNPNGGSGLLNLPPIPFPNEIKKHLPLIL